MDDIRIEFWKNGINQEIDDYVAGHPKSRIYHTTRWNSIIEKTFGHKTHYLILRNGGNKILGICPVTAFSSLLFGKFAISLPFVNYGGPLLDDHEDFCLLADYLSRFRLSHKWEYIELRLEEKIDTYIPFKQHKVTFFLDLPQEEEELWRSFKAKLRSQIRRPLKEGMDTKFGNIELLNDYYYVFSRNMRDLGTPVYTKKFFHNILTTYPTNSFIVVVYDRLHRPIATSFLLKFKDIMEIPWASSLRKYNRYSPNMLLYWESFKLAITEKCRVFDFGRCTPGEGTYRFKKQWGGQECPLFWYYILPKSEDIPQLNPSNPKYKLAIKIWRKLPLFITNSIGPYIIKNIP